jgi:ABC-2 type transport system permease protein
MVSFFFTISILSMIFLPILWAGLLRRRISVHWLWFSVGMATFTFSQLVHIPLNNWLADIGILNSPIQPGEQPLWQIAILLVLTASLCEEFARAAGYSLVSKIKKWHLGKTIGLPEGLMTGLGHGGIESMVFGGVQLAVMFGSFALTPHGEIDISQFGDLPVEQLHGLQTQINTLFEQPWYALLPLLERILATGIHASLSVMVLQSVTQRKPLYLLLAIVYHMLIDAFAVMGWTRLDNGLGIQFVFFLTVLPGYIWLWVKVKSKPAFPNLRPNTLRREGNLFFNSLLKELFQLWRTRRFLIVAAIFGLLGLASPLVAYFMPSLLSMIPGAEAFASLVPIPTAGDAVSQYHKNITQFALLLAVIIGMGSVAGEKEQGTATLILSKPLPRWAFLSSKLAAQFILYLSGFALAAIGGYIYTFILFGYVDIIGFFQMNLVLIAWLLPFTGLILLGSVLGSTTSAAGGISLTLVLMLLLASNLPIIGSLMPASLSQWAAQIGALAAGVAASTPGSIPLPSGPVLNNWRALAAALVIILLSLVLSFGFFEQQEL